MQRKKMGQQLWRETAGHHAIRAMGGAGGFMGGGPLVRILTYATACIQDVATQVAHLAARQAQTASRGGPSAAARKWACVADHVYAATRELSLALDTLRTLTRDGREGGRS